MRGYDRSKLSNIDIAQAAKMRRITDVARERLGIPEEALEAYGKYKAKISLDYISKLNGKPNGKLVLVTAISPTPAGEGKTTTTVGSRRCAQPDRQEGADLPARAGARPGVRHEGWRGRRRLLAGRADGGHQPALHRRLRRHRAGQQPAGRRSSTTTSTRATSWASTCAASPGAAWST